MKTCWRLSTWYNCRAVLRPRSVSMTLVTCLRVPGLLPLHFSRNFFFKSYICGRGRRPGYWRPDQSRQFLDTLLSMAGLTSAFAPEDCLSGQKAAMCPHFRHSKHCSSPLELALLLKELPAAHAVPFVGVPRLGEGLCSGLAPSLCSGAANCFT